MVETFKPKAESTYAYIETYLSLPEEQLKRIIEICRNAHGSKEDEVLASIDINFLHGEYTYAGKIDIAWSEMCNHFYCRGCVSKFKKESPKPEEAYKLESSDDPFNYGYFFLENEKGEGMYINLRSEVNFYW